jgi:HSP20 family protein
MSLFLANPLSLLTSEEPYAMNPFRSLVLGAFNHSSRCCVALDVLESPSYLIISVDLPGLKKEQVSMRIKDNILIISGERAMNKEVEGQTIHIAERVLGSFERRVRLPSSVDLNMIDASMVDGVLEVKIGMSSFR